MDMELMLAHMIAKQKAEMHLEFIKTNGEKGRSAIQEELRRMEEEEN